MAAAPRIVAARPPARRPRCPVHKLAILSVDHPALAVAGAPRAVDTQGDEGYMRSVLFLLLAVAATGCALPQTPQEMREVYKRSGSSANIEKFAVNRPFAAALTDVKANADQCLNARDAHGYFEGGVFHAESAVWHSTTRKTSEKTAEVTLQLDKKNVVSQSKMPEGGWFMMLADLEATAPGKTDVTVYHPAAPAGYADLSKAIAAWADGKKAPCPKLP
jgi:hypothetical protein